MKRLFLTSSVSFVAQDIAKRIDTKGKKLAFVITPAEVEDGPLDWLKADRQSLVDIGFEVTDYTFTGKTKEQVREFLKDCDVLYMSGGNTFWFLKKIQEANCADVIRSFVESGKIYIGTSAGSIIAGANILPTRNLEKFNRIPKLESYEGLGFVNFVIMAHWGSKSFKERYVNERMEQGYTEDYSIVLLPDDSYILVEDDNYKIIKVKQN